MQLKRLPVLAGLAREVRVTGWGRAARKAGLVWGEQTTQELAQNAIAPVFETIASAMRSDMTPRDAGQEFSRYVEDIPATLAATGWLALIGGGLASVRDIKNPQADVDVALRHWGFSAEQSRRIKAAATPEAFDAAVHEEMPRRTPENIASGRRQAEAAWRQAEQQQADPAQPRLEAITRGERGTEWIVRDSEGRETLRTPNSETAQLALAELQQSAARQKQASMLRFSKSGDQAENVGRMWVELARDKRTMQHGETSDAKDIGTLLTEISKAAGQDVQISEQKALNGQNVGYVFQGSDGGTINVDRDVLDEYYFDTQNAGKHSTPINQAAYAWALNNGNKMVEDPRGLLYLGVLRRTSQMLSAALRAGTTRHMEPGPDSKITGWREEKSEADFFHNVGLLAMKEAELVHGRLKGVDALRYDGESQAFYDGEHRIPDEKVNSYLGERIGGVDPDFSERIGPATLRRALATRFAEEAGTLGGGRLGQHAEASAVLHRIRYARNVGGEQEVPGSQETSAGGEPAEVSGGTRRPQDNGGLSREQARQWVDEVLRKWGSQLDVTVHESAGAIPDAAMRDEVLREGDVDAFFNGSDGKIHLLADRVNSVSDAERLLKHEGFHWAVGGKLRVEYGQLVEAIGRKIPTDGMQEIIARYPKGTPELWVEEYLAHLAETNPQSPLWRQFVYEVKRLLRRVFGDRIEYTEQDIRAFLSKAQQRAARAKAADAAEFAKAQQELRFGKSPKPRGWDRKVWSDIQKGDNWDSVKKLLPKEDVLPSFLDVSGDQHTIVLRAAEFIRHNAIVSDWTGRTVYLPYGQSRGGYNNDLMNRAEHLIGVEEEKGSHLRELDRDKAKWLAVVPETIRKASVRVRHRSEVLYFRNYRGSVHMVITSQEGVLVNQQKIDSGLVTSFSIDIKRSFKGAIVDNIR